MSEIKTRAREVLIQNEKGQNPVIVFSREKIADIDGELFKNPTYPISKELTPDNLMTLFKWVDVKGVKHENSYIDVAQIITGLHGHLVAEEEREQAELIAKQEKERAEQLAEQAAHQLFGRAAGQRAFARREAGRGLEELQFTFAAVARSGLRRAR
jgi:hypothetical protein